MLDPGWLVTSLDVTQAIIPASGPPWQWTQRAILARTTSLEAASEPLARIEEHFGAIRSIAQALPSHLKPLLGRLPLAEEKARSLCECARRLILRHGGRVPLDPQDIMLLAGIDRLGAARIIAFGHALAALPIDLPGRRVLKRLDVHDADLARTLPAAQWISCSCRLDAIGRDFCRPERPWCSKCPLQSRCPKQGIVTSR